MADSGSTEMPLVSVITPAYNERENLPILYNRLSQTLADMRWEWIVVDDHSSDGTFDVIKTLSREDSNVRGFRMARNFGSHIAIRCGLEHAAGDCAVVLAADLQDPPETITPMLERWRQGISVVWAVRRKREGERWSTLLFARVYYWLMRNVVGLNTLPPSGADFFMIDRCVVDTINRFQESNTSLFAQLCWLGYRQSWIEYDKEERLHGASGWNLEKKIKLLVDSITSFSYKPIRYISYLGALFSCLGFAYALFILGNAWFGAPIQGWSSFMVVLLLVGGLLMLMLGIIGEYLWRAFDESRRRPLYWIERNTGRMRVDETV